MLLVMLLLDRQFFTPRIVPERPTIAFGDSVSEDASSLAQTLSLLQQAQAVSVLTNVHMPHDSAAVKEGGRPHTRRDWAGRAGPNAGR
ncbi:hypothetical protein ACGFYQ_40145 [Streptomyces sp. NPDC048258]|uniref:hypothetical protein n=1 Tax=Streptomyces sp. NPDC048258 TaxID=3365527 RepID=UPI00372087BD